MAISPRIVTADVVFPWDGVSQRLPKGQVLDVPPDSALERAIGLENLAPLGAVAAQPPAEEPAPQEELPASPPKPRTVAKKQDVSDGKDGDT